MRFLRTNTAVIVTVGPFYDKTDGVTIETALTITNERITLTADTDAGSAPTNVLDNITGATSATANDLNYITGNDAGMMQLELAAADTNRLGRMFLSITDAANHVPVFHEFMVMPALVYDTFFASSGGATFPAATLASTTNITAGTITTATTATNVTTVNGLAANVITAASMAADASAEIADAVWDEDATGHQTTGTFGQAIGDPVADTNTIYKAVVTDATGATVGADVVAMKVDTAAILVDTGTTLDAALAVVDANVDAILVDTAVIGAAGAGLTAVPWNASWDAEVQSEVDDALVVQRLDELINADSDIDGLAPPTVGSVIHEMLSKTAGSFTFDQTTDSLEAIRDKETDIETDTAEIGVAGVGLTNIGTIATVTTLTNKTGFSLAATGLDAVGAAATGVQAIVDAVWDEDVDAGHQTAGTAGKKLDDAGAAADPWATALPGAYGAGTAGKIVGDNVNAPIATVDTVVDAIKTKTDSLTFTVANQVDANAQSINDVTLTGDGQVGTEFGI